MDGASMLAVAATCTALVALAALAWAFRHGALLVLLTGRAEAGEGERALGRRMAVVLLVGCALMATLLVFQGAELARSASLARAASLANNVAFLAFIAAVVWFFIVQRPDRDEDARKARPRAASLDHLHAATIVFVVCLLAVVGVVGLLAAGV